MIPSEHALAVAMGHIPAEHDAAIALAGDGLDEWADSYEDGTAEAHRL
jgi:hypothetical protein